jgi:peptide subunit release factor RF-3
MSSVIDARKINTEVAERINQEAKANPDSPYAGKYVGIANGKVVTVGDSFEEGLRLLRQAEPDNTRAYLLEVGADYSETEFIWEQQ